MHRIAVSGHRGLPGSTADMVGKAIQVALAGYAPNLVGLSCLADGADQIFARTLTDVGGGSKLSSRPPSTVMGSQPTRTPNMTGYWVWRQQSTACHSRGQRHRHTWLRAS